MKQSAVLLSAAAALVAAQNEVPSEGPYFGNLVYDVEAGSPFELNVNQCPGECTIVLQAGPSGSAEDYEVLTTSASNGDVSVTVEDVPTGEYSFRIFDNEDEESMNWSETFELEGTDPEPTEEETTVVETTTVAATTTTVVETTATESSEVSTETTMVTTTMSTTTTGTKTTSTSTEEATETTTVPDSLATGLKSPIGLVAAVLAGLALFA